MEQNKLKWINWFWYVCGRVVDFQTWSCWWGKKDPKIRSVRDRHGFKILETTVRLWWGSPRRCVRTMFKRNQWGWKWKDRRELIGRNEWMISWSVDAIYFVDFRSGFFSQHLSPVVKSRLLFHHLPSKQLVTKAPNHLIFFFSSLLFSLYIFLNL